MRVRCSLVLDSTRKERSAKHSVNKKRANLLLAASCGFIQFLPTSSSAIHKNQPFAPFRHGEQFGLLTETPTTFGGIQHFAVLLPGRNLWTARFPRTGHATSPTLPLFSYRTSPDDIPCADENLIQRLPPRASSRQHSLCLAESLR